MGKLMTLIGDKIAQGSDVFDPLARLVNDPDVFAGNFPLRLAGALHGFVLENPDCALAKAYPPHNGTKIGFGPVLAKRLHRMQIGLQHG